MPAALRNPKQLPVKALPLVIGDVGRNDFAVTLHEAEIAIDYIDGRAFRARRPAADYALLAPKPDRKKTDVTVRLTNKK